MRLNGRAIFKAVGKAANKNGATVLTVLAAIGVIATGVLAAKAKPVADDRVARAKEDKAMKEAEESGGKMPDFDGTKLTFFEKFKAAAPAYVMTIIVGGITIFCVVGSHVMSVRQIGDLAAGYNVAQVINQKYEKYSEKVKEVVGEEKEAEIRKEVNHEVTKERIESIYTISERDISKVAIFTGDGMQLFYDPFSDRFFYSSREAIKDGIHNLIQTGPSFVTMNDIYEYIHLPSCRAGDYLGWNMNSRFNCIEPTFSGAYDLTKDGFSYIELGFYDEPRTPAENYI